MAAKQQHKGTGLEIQYEDLVPKSEWKDKPEASLLTIDLPGFAKEQVKVTYVHTSKMIKITGERPLADRRWSRFNKVFTVPENCLVDKISGSFKNNVLTITMPKETITKIPEASKTVAERVEKLEEKRLLEESIRKEKAEEAEKKKMKKLLEEKDEMIKKLQEEVKAKEMAEARKLQEEAIAKEKDEARKLEEEGKSKEKPEERKLVEEVTPEKIKEKIQKPEESKVPEVGKVGEVVKSTKEKLGYLVDKEKKIGKGMLEKIKRKDLTGEEKKLMVNVGVAAFVIFTLGAYVTYTYCSSSSSSPSPSSSSPSSSSSSSTKPE